MQKRAASNEISRILRPRPRRRNIPQCDGQFTDSAPSSVEPSPSKEQKKNRHSTDPNFLETIDDTSLTWDSDHDLPVYDNSSQSLDLSRESLFSVDQNRNRVLELMEPPFNFTFSSDPFVGDRLYTYETYISYFHGNSQQSAVGLSAAKRRHSI